MPTHESLVHHTELKVIMQVIKKLFRQIGLEVRRLNQEPPAKTIRSQDLSLYTTSTGKYYLPTRAKSDIIVRKIIDNEVFDEHIIKLAQQIVTDGTIVLDIGSNFGQLAVLMSKLVGTCGKVFAFEADPFIYSVLKKNTDLNATNIEPIFGAVHVESGQTLYFPEQDFVEYGSYGSYGIDYVGGKGRPISTIAIDSIDFDRRVSFMKIDVQGGDLFVLQGARKTITKHRMPIVFEYEHAFEKSQDLCFQDYVDFVREIDYRFCRFIDGHDFLILPAEAFSRPSAGKYF
jgi:FkbM family methyltransferase